jgi:thiol-disulfide isomerase/thioredoxin
MKCIQNKIHELREKKEVYETIRFYSSPITLMKPKAKVIYPSYYLTTGTDSGGNPMFYPKTVFYDNGYKYVLKLIGNPYPKVIDVIAEHFMKNNLCANQEAAVENAIHAMELVYRSFASMTEK